MVSLLEVTIKLLFIIKLSHLQNALPHSTPWGLTTILSGWLRKLLSNVEWFLFTYAFSYRLGHLNQARISSLLPLKISKPSSGFWTEGSLNESRVSCTGGGFSCCCYYFSLWILGPLFVCSCVCSTLMKPGTDESDSALEQGGPELYPTCHFNRLQHKNIWTRDKRR